MTTVLVVDDDRDIRELIALRLRQLDIDVHVAGDGEAGLAAVRSLLPDLVLLDWMMPVLSGIEVCVAVRANPDTAEIPVILLTAKAQEADVERGLAAGADAYIRKPFSLAELTDRVRGFLDPA
jgi:two-component system phosphate regulon response regulator PhoB